MRGLGRRSYADQRRSLMPLRPRRLHEANNVINSSHAGPQIRALGMSAFDPERTS